MLLLSWREQVRNMKSHFINLVFPPVCANCRQVGEILCQRCLTQVEWVRAPICEVCGRDLLTKTHVCHFCRQRPLPLKQIRAAVRFSTIIPDLIHQLKYRNTFALAEPLGILMAQAWPDWQVDVDVVLPVPLHAQRQKERGYNQADLLVDVFCRERQLPSHKKILYRIRKTPPQVGLNAADRRQNMKGAFAIENPHLVKGGKFLLVDDVCTTGATLVAATEALLDAGAETVSAYCLARAV
ncbi:MAG: hypothetical protein CSA11_02365 [Chloroflexi bacterium]|nr:MAG: hypothetical protein CSA11_02365 [Chloroflexota bacterium]